MKIKVVHKYFLVAFVSIVLCVVLGFLATGYIGRVIIDSSNHPQFGPPIFFAKIVDLLNTGDRVQAVKKLVASIDNSPFPELVLIDDNGKVLFPESYSLPFNWNEIEKPLKAYDFIKLPNMDHSPEIENFHPPHHPGSIWDHGGPPMPPPPMESPVLVRLDQPTPLFLLIPPPKLIPMMGEGHNNFFRFMPWIGIISMLISLLLGVGTAIALINSSVKRNVSLADEVISQLQNGNLKARFPIRRKDEFGRAMMRFNVMAEEIEKLVEQLRSVENSRTKLLQELAHDLRTPIASLKNLLETLHLKGEAIGPEVQKEFMELSLKEVEYFERLVEDLLFLVQMREPKYQTQRESIDIVEILEEEAEDCVFRVKQQIDQGKNIDLVKNFDSQSVFFNGDLHLIRRLFRNALENAFSFASSRVKLLVALEQDGKSVLIHIEDDGPGFTQETLQAFAERKMSRTLTQGEGKRLSVGLGSVIMKAICTIHRGKLSACNDMDANGNIRGACIEIKLPV
jgi:signal transduction histidine kinase